MDYQGLIKTINLPSNFVAPRELRYDDLVAHPLSRKDLQDDLDAVNTSIELIQRTRGGSWPTGKLDSDTDLLDLAWHEREFRDGNSFAYVVYSTSGEYIGCFYLYGIGIRAELTENSSNYDVDASWWVSNDAYNKGYYEKLYKAIQQWLTIDFPFTKVHYSNKQIPS